MIEEPELYFWKDSQVVPLNWNNPIPDRLRGCYCVDVTCPKSEDERYGMLKPNQKGWKTLPFEEFPTDFQMALLLLGVE